MIQQTRVPEIAIVGGGPSGLALAGMLERAGMDFVLYERGSRDEAPRGGCLDLHKGSGQRAMKEAGCWAEMEKYGRRGDATVHWVFDHLGNRFASWGEGHDAPELDRYDIKRALLTTVPDAKIQWDSHMTEANRDGKGQVILRFADGSTASGFKLVVGADGAWSKIRHLVTPAVPQYAKRTFLSSKIHADNPFYETVLKSAGSGPQIILGRRTKIWNQMQGDGHFRIDFGVEKPADWVKKGGFDPSDTEATKKALLAEDLYGTHGQYIKDLLNAAEGPFMAWPLWHMPVNQLNWQPNSDVTLIGDAAHVTPPFVGDGCNCAMRDSIILSQRLKEFGITKEAVAAYEKEMHGFAIDLIERSLEAGDLFFHQNAPAALIEGFAKKPLMGTMDDV